MKSKSFSIQYTHRTSLALNAKAHSAEQKLYLRNRLDSIQRHAALMITRGLKSSPTANLEILAGIQPINLKLQEQVLKSALRLKRHGAWDKNYQFRNNNWSNTHALSTRFKGKSHFARVNYRTTSPQ